MTRTAILFSGSAYNIKFSIQSAMDNLVIPNNADVFIVTERRCLRRRVPSGYIPHVDEWDAFEKKTRQIQQHLSEPLTDGEIQLMRNTFGDRLKVLYLIEEDAGYMNYIMEERRKMMNEVNSYRRENSLKGVKPPFGNDITTLDNGNLRCVIDQFRHIKKAYDLMCDYENKNGFKYDYVMRARIDFVVPEKLSVEYYTLPHDKAYWYIMGSVLRDPFLYSEEFCWFSKRSICDKIYEGMNRMGLITDRKYETYYAPQGNDFRFGAETQFALLIHELGIPYINVKVYRATMFSKGDDGYDYMNYFFRRYTLDLQEEYELACKCESDINEHLPKLREYAEKCHHITEFGTRYGNSTIAFLSAHPRKFITYDVTPNDRIEYVQILAKDSHLDFEFRNENVEQIEIEETDLLFIDTNHHEEQCSNELRLHADKARKYIIFHDTNTFWEKGQGHESGHGLRYAIEPFLASHPEWGIDYRADNNNGLLILARRE